MPGTQRRLDRSVQPFHNGISRAGFTLVELLIVISILLILATLTLALFNSTSESDKIRSSARQLQSSLLGARDRAIKARVPRGLRLILQDTSSFTGPGTVTSSPGAKVVTNMLYIGAPDYWRQGSIQVGRPDFSVASAGHVETTPNNNLAETTNQIIVRGYQTDWSLLLVQGLIGNGSRIEIPANSGEWYTINTDLIGTPPMGIPMGSPEFLVLQGGGYRGMANAKYSANSVDSQDLLVPGADQLANYRLELNPTILPGQEPMRLSSGIVIDLDRSAIPPTWFTLDVSGTTRSYNPFGATAPTSIDIMFSPRGWVSDGAVASSGAIHFYLCTQEDADLNNGVMGTATINDPMLNGIRNAADPKAGEKLVLSLFPQTGNVSTSPVDVTDYVENANPSNMTPDGLADDPFKNAKIGGTAGR